VLFPTSNQVCQTLNIKIYQFVHVDIPSSSTCQNDLMWFSDGSNIFVHCVGGHDLPIQSCDFSNILELDYSKAMFNEHVLNPYIFKNFDEYGIPYFVDPFIFYVISCAPTSNSPPNFMSLIYSSTSIPISCLSYCDMSMASCSKEVMSYRSEDICPIFGSKHVKEIVACDHVMVSIAFNCGDGTNLDSLVKNPILKSHFLDIDKKEFENVNKGGRKVNKHVGLWTKNAFDEWKVFCGFDTSKFMLSSLILQVAKEDNNLFLQ
jgi:hypothetical protein